MKFSKLANSLTASATMAATLKAQDLKSKGVTLVVGTVGEPHEPVDAEIKNALTNYLNTKPSRYVSAQGLLDTRLALSDWFHQVYQTKYTPEQIVITPGSKFGLYALLQLLCDADDEVIIPTPYWVSYITQAQLAKAKPVICNTDETYKLNATLLRGAITKHSRLLILNSPNNPSGAVYTKNELHSLYLVLKEHPQITVLCDDIYNQLIFTPDERAPSLLDVADEDFKKNQLIIVHGVSKSYAMTGWRLGWIAADKECIEKLTSFISQTLTCVPDFIQYATQTALKNSFHSVQI